jgi:hypothetical protein
MFFYTIYMTNGVTVQDGPVHRIKLFTDRQGWATENLHSILIGLGGPDSSSCVTEPELIQSRPSVLATASISAAVRGLNSPSAAFALSSVCALTRVDPAVAEHVVRRIECVVATEVASLQILPTANSKVTNSASSSSKLVSVADETGQPETPTDVQDVHF